MPERGVRRRTRGWRKPPGAVIVTRPTRWGNPYRVAPHGPYTAAEAAGLYRRDLLAGTLISAPGREPTTVAEVRRELAGRDLLCTCPIGQPCHADVLLTVANT